MLIAQILRGGGGGGGGRGDKWKESAQCMCKHVYLGWSGGMLPQEFYNP